MREKNEMCLIPVEVEMNLPRKGCVHLCNGIFSGFGRKEVTWSRVNTIMITVLPQLLALWYWFCTTKTVWSHLWTFRKGKKSNSYWQLSPGIKCMVAKTWRNGLSLLFGCQIVTWHRSQYSCLHLMPFEFHEMW